MGERCVYLIASDTGRIKIGIAWNPVSRLGQLQTGNPHKLKLLWAFETDVGLPAEWIENAIHTRLRVYRRVGEWFDAPMAVIFWAIKNAWVELTRPDIFARWQRRFGRYVRMMERQALHFTEQAYLVQSNYEGHHEIALHP